LEVFSALPLKERLFVRARMFSAPLAAVAERCPEGDILDVGCGHGALIALLAMDGARRIMGLDPDERKIAWARLGPGRLPNVSLQRGEVGDLLPRHPRHFDAVAVVDVLYLLPVARWPSLVADCARLLKPGGLLLLKEAAANRSWKHFKCLAQEQVMVRLLRRTHSSGGLHLQPRSFTENLLMQQGLAVRETVDLSAGYSTPHILFVAASP
jgi:2-polyprenyl-6-hydroxyphenyl methylase/3-demethylubiquinone-9 3-methyltransferase